MIKLRITLDWCVGCKLYGQTDATPQCGGGRVGGWGLDRRRVQVLEIYFVVRFESNGFVTKVITDSMVSFIVLYNKTCIK